MGQNHGMEPEVWSDTTSSYYSSESFQPPWLLFFLTKWYTKTTVNIDTINATNVLIYLHITAKLLDRLIIIFPIIAFNIAILILHTNACRGSGSNSYFDPDALHKQPIYLDLGLDPAPMAMELGSEIRSVKDS